MLTNLAECLLEEYESERFRMMRSPVMYATVFLDRRYAADLKSGELELAKIALCNMWERFQKHHNGRNTAPQPENEEEDDLFDLDQYMLSKTANNSAPSVTNATPDDFNQTPNYMMSKAEFLLVLDKFETKYPAINTKSNIIFEFIEENISQFPEIYVVANILFGIPPSQTSVERSFSHFTFVYNYYRNTLKPILLEYILFLRINKVLVKVIVQEELNDVDTNCFFFFF